MNAHAVVAVVGLGYVGLPLAVEFGKRGRTLGFDLSATKIEHYRNGVDPTGEVAGDDLKAAVHLEVGTDPAVLGEADFIIVAVPTPVDVAHQPDFAPLAAATRTVGWHMKRGAIVVFESTVYPGATEEVCIPILEQVSGMRWQQDFHVGFSPERINPGDREHTLTTIPKVVSGDDEATLGRIAALYETIVEAGVYRASESWDSLPRSDALVVAVGHREVMEHSSDEFRAKLNEGGCFIDVKAQFDPGVFSKAGHCVWRL